MTPPNSSVNKFGCGTEGQESVAEMLQCTAQNVQFQNTKCKEMEDGGIKENVLRLSTLGEYLEFNREDGAL